MAKTKYRGSSIQGAFAALGMTTSLWDGERWKKDGRAFNRLGLINRLIFLCSLSRRISVVCTVSKSLGMGHF